MFCEVRLLGWRMDGAEVGLSIVSGTSIAHKTCASFLLKCILLKSKIGCCCTSSPLHCSTLSCMFKEVLYITEQS